MMTLCVGYTETYVEVFRKAFLWPKSGEYRVKVTVGKWLREEGFSGIPRTKFGTGALRLILRLVFYT